MIRYSYTEAQIRAAVAALDPGWLRKATERKTAFITAKKYNEPSGIWSDIKAIYIDMQKNKCIFCERKFSSPQYGKIEHDVEHFRPKSSVKAWPPAKLGLSHDFALGGATERGYYWLAYDLLNYATSCGICNSTCKSNYFPVDGKRKYAPASISALAAEKPFLCYPIGTLDDDPESLVTFSATTAIPVRKSGAAHRRGRVIIDFFKLNLREELHRERAAFITFYGLAQTLVDLQVESNENTALAARLVDASTPHAACTRAFSRLWVDDKTTAGRVYKACRDFTAGITTQVPPPL